MKVAFISRHPAPYRDPLLKRLAADSRLSVEIFNELPLDAGHDFWDLKEHGYEARDLYPKGAGRVRRIGHLLTTFVFGKYDFVLWSGFNTLEPTLAILIAALLGKRYGFMADTVAQRPIAGVRAWLKRIIVRNASLIFVPGEAGASFWKKTYGVNAKSLAKGAYALDGFSLEREIVALRASRNEIRARFGIAPEEKVFLMVANMIPTRHYPIMAAAFERFCSRHAECRFVMVGKGPDYKAINEHARHCRGLVAVNGCSFDEMKSLYAISDVYVHGGTEPASTALVIGAIAGLPLVSSDAVGCAEDVLIDGQTGVKTSDYLSEDAWLAAFEEIYSKRSLWSEMGRAAREVSKVLDVEKVHEALVAKLI